jgi:carbamate kinase
MKAVVALGGNALTGKDRRTDIDRQFEATRRVAASVATMITNGWHIVLTHGNGPQVGSLLLQQKLARDEVPPMPLHVLGALTQGQTGYIIQQCLYNEFLRRDIDRDIATVVTQTLVDAGDPAFQSPTKPVGPVYDDDEAATLKKTYTMGKAAGGWRILVPSPEPLSIVESPVIKDLIEDNIVVVAAGGGGIPVVKRGDSLAGVSAVIDKDRASEILATEVGADILLILTDVDHVYVDYGTPDQQALHDVSAADLKRHYAAGQFPEGSMGPKVQAALSFLAHGGERAEQVIIAPIDRAWDALQGNAGTRITA